MTLIDHNIPIQNFERIPPQIYSILQNEFVNQVYSFNNLNCFGVTFWSERTKPIDKSESPIIIISTFKGNYANKSIGSVHGTYQYVLDFMTNAASVSGTPGEQSAGRRLQKLMGLVRYVLEHPNYIKLGFDTAPFFIEHTEVTLFQIYKDERVGDASNTASGQIIFTVQCDETTTPNGGVLLAQSDTNVLIEETVNGYQYTTVA